MMFNSLPVFFFFFFLTRFVVNIDASTSHSVAYLRAKKKDGNVPLLSTRSNSCRCPKQLTVGGRKCIWHDTATAVRFP